MKINWQLCGVRSSVLGLLISVTCLLCWGPYPSVLIAVVVNRPPVGNRMIAEQAYVALDQCVILGSVCGDENSQAHPLHGDAWLELGPVLASSRNFKV